jgi:formate hydrogenlyase subunit 3/multisubunit Na+/H+ antiporter MnhD subunit
MFGLSHSTLCIQHQQHKQQLRTSFRIFFAMHFSNTFLVAAITIGFAAAGQVNFYSDKNCKNYIGEAHPGIQQITGQAILFAFPPTITFRLNFQIFTNN